MSNKQADLPVGDEHRIFSPPGSLAFMWLFDVEKGAATGSKDKRRETSQSCSRIPCPMLANSSVSKGLGAE